MHFRPLSRVSRHAFIATSVALLLAAVTRLAGQNVATSLLVLSRDARRAIPITVSGGQEMVALDDLASTFQLVVREERSALTVSYKGRTVVLTPDQPMASVSGRLIALPAAPTRVGNRWIVPIDFISRALLPIYDSRLELRRPSHLLIVGDLRVPQLVLRQELIGGGARVTVETTPRATVTIVQEANQRITLKFDADAIDVSLPASQAPGIVQSFRAVDNTTIAIDLGPRFASFRSTTQVVDTSARLVLDLLTPPGDTPPTPATTQNEPAAPAELPNIVPPAPSLRTVMIDPGHGGDDIGAKGAGGTTEKDVTLAIARRLKATIEARMGLRVLMTREDDRSVAVSDRTALANTNKADVFISLHANASFRNTVSGAAVYTAVFDTDAVSLPLTTERLPAYGGGFRDIELVPWDLAQIRYKEQSDRLAKMIVEGFQSHVPLAARPLDHAALRVLESANMPAVLIEVGYLSNADQEKRLLGAEFQSGVVQAIADALARLRDALVTTEGDAR